MIRGVLFTFIINNDRYLLAFLFIDSLFDHIHGSLEDPG
jgi:hypothetical protein